MWKKTVVPQFYLQFLYEENPRKLRIIIGDRQIYISGLLYRIYSISGSNY